MISVIDTFPVSIFALLTFNLYIMLNKFNKWFNKTFGWFFTNGRKFHENPSMYDEGSNKN